jgi:hypothetical protein
VVGNACYREPPAPIRIRQIFNQGCNGSHGFRLRRK